MIENKYEWIKNVFAGFQAKWVTHFFLQSTRTLGLQNAKQNVGLQSHLQTKPWTAKLNLGLQKTPQKIALGAESEALGAESEALFL